MKCKQKSCKRNQNLNITSGFCNICHEVSQEATNEIKKKEESSMEGLKKVNIDYKEMIKMHEKLVKGEAIDYASTSSVILGGIINILVQHSALEGLETRVDTLEKENISNKARIESLENWNTKQADEMKKLMKNIEVLDQNVGIGKETEDLTILNKKISLVEVEVTNLKSSKHFQSQKSKVNENDVRKTRTFCSVCSETFEKNSDLEMHLMEEHQEQKKFKCKECNKDFML